MVASKYVDDDSDELEPDPSGDEGDQPETKQEAKTKGGSKKPAKPAKPAKVKKRKTKKTQPKAVKTKAVPIASKVKEFPTPAKHVNGNSKKPHYGKRVARWISKGWRFPAQEGSLMARAFEMATDGVPISTFKSFLKKKASSPGYEHLVFYIVKRGHYKGARWRVDIDKNVLKIGPIRRAQGVAA